MTMNIKLSPKVSFNEVDDHDRMFCLLLAFHSSFQKDINDARKVLNIKQIVDYPKDATMSDLIRLFSRTVKGSSLDKVTESLMRKYELTDNWKYSIKSALVTNTLLVPEDIEPMFISLPSRTKPLILEILETDDPKLKEYLITKRLFEAYKYPSIEIRRQVSINEIKTWLTKHKDVFDLLQMEVPRKNTVSIEEKTFYWGTMVALNTHEGKKPEYTKLCTMFNDAFDPQEIPFEVPDEAALRTHYMTYLKSLKNRGMPA